MMMPLLSERFRDRWVNPAWPWHLSEPGRWTPERGFGSYPYCPYPVWWAPDGRRP